jgi:hypothetical protein
MGQRDRMLVGGQRIMQLLGKGPLRPLYQPTEQCKDGLPPLVVAGRAPAFCEFGWLVR